MKVTGVISYHLGCDFFRDDEDILCMVPKKYIEKMIDWYLKNMFNKKPSTTYKSPLEKGDHPELDITELLDEDGIQKFQSLISSLKWAVSIGIIGIATAVMSISSFRSAPRIGHLERAKRIIGYLFKMKEVKLHFRVSLPDYSYIAYVQYDW